MCQAMDKGNTETIQEIYWHKLRQSHIAATNRGERELKTIY